MKALVRNDGETILETSHIPNIDWETGYPFTDKDWPNRPYKLIINYSEPEGEPAPSGDPLNN